MKKNNNMLVYYFKRFYLLWYYILKNLTALTQHKIIDWKLNESLDEKQYGVRLTI